MSNECPDGGNHMDSHPQNKDGVIKYNRAWDSYYLVVNKYPRITQDLFYCPWCGIALPKSQCDKWHEELEALGIDWRTDEIPEEYKSEAWRTRG